MHFLSFHCVAQVTQVAPTSLLLPPPGCHCQSRFHLYNGSLALHTSYKNSNLFLKNHQHCLILQCRTEIVSLGMRLSFLLFLPSTFSLLMPATAS